ncbi:MAG: RNA methyltransferase [Chloroflexota bacterium]
MNRYPSVQSLIEMIRRVGSRQGRRSTGLYSIEGTRLVERALGAGAPLEAVLVARRLVESDQLRHQALIENLQISGTYLNVAPDQVLTELTCGRDLGQILGLVRLPEPVALDKLVEASTSPSPTASPMFLVAVDIVDPGNVGALIRTAHAAGAAGLLATGASDPFHPRATRISRGSIFRLPVITYKTSADLMNELRRLRVCATAAIATGGTSLPEAAWPAGAVAVLMGNEAEGLPVEVVQNADCLISIPMASEVDSFSVNAAAAIIMYQIRHSHPIQWSGYER